MRVDLTAPEKDKIKNAINSDPMIAAMVGRTYAQIDAWVDTNVNTIADVKGVLKRLIKIVVFVIRLFKLA